MKKFILTFFFLIFISIVYSQNKIIDSLNYYDYYNMNAHYKKSSIRTKHLSTSMIADIVYDEMKKNGFKYVNQFQIVKIDSLKYVNSICYSEDFKFGFLLDDLIDLIPLKKNRYVVSLSKEHNGLDYREKIISINGSSEFLDFKTIPNNFYILKTDNYWYQESEIKNENENLVSKTFIIELLRNDIRKVLSKIKK
ncbi:hypothetical protein OX284_012100 [Flavobacterium sp. SUN046]|uniref:hypothetical protein n=1 Tax=Flavobacterium sp. SUN046 TaxID=3002440 RepID=UPI002DB836DC|nr:hypothetical protein [Flavobacterium sp. SUN046]MEC4050177.1 hypothetical protein [Flavobacterium sp. SUN046]